MLQQQAALSVSIAAADDQHPTALNEISLEIFYFVCAVPLKLSGLRHVNLDVYNNNNNNNAFLGFSVFLFLLCVRFSIQQ